MHAGLADWIFTYLFGTIFSGEWVACGSLARGVGRISGGHADSNRAHECITANLMK